MQIPYRFSSRMQGDAVSTATVTSKGQITIPSKVRGDMGLVAGDRVEFIRM